MKPPSFAVHATGSRGEAVVREVLSLVPPEDVVEIVTATDSGNLDNRELETQMRAQALNIPFRDHRTLWKAPAADPEVWRILVGWRQMVEPTPRTIILHDSLLPFYRGFAPVVATLIEGRHMLGATAFFATERFDEGDIIFNDQCNPPLRIKDAFVSVADMYVGMTRKIVKTLRRGGELPREQQMHEYATYTPWRDSIDYCLDWRLDSPRLYRTVYALGWPYAGARVCVRLSDGKRFFGVVHEASVATDVSFVGPRPIGKMLFREKGSPIVVCGTGMLSLDKIEWSDGFELDALRVRFLLPEDYAL